MRAVARGRGLALRLEANDDNSLVSFVYDIADVVDLGFFDLDNPIKAFDEDNAAKKTALFNYGIGAILYLIVGRVVEKLIHP